MSEELEVVYLRVTPDQKAKLERMRKRSGRRSIQNVVEIIIATADESAPEWNIIPQPTPAPEAQAEGR
jgi:hypothetical protein